LRGARRRANLTQKELADRLGTTQPAVARLENDLDGRISLHRFIDYALACDEIPLPIELEPVERVREYAVAQASAAISSANYANWIRNTVGSTFQGSSTTVLPNLGNTTP